MQQHLKEDKITQQQFKGYLAYYNIIFYATDRMDILTPSLLFNQGNENKKTKKYQPLWRKTGSTINVLCVLVVTRV